MNNKTKTNGKPEVIRFTDTDEPLDIRYDNIFKAVFTRDTPASKTAISGLISALIQRKVNVQTIVANEPPVNNVFDRRIRFDIACKAESGELINIEMSFCPESHEPVRLEYYASRQFSGQGIQGIEMDYSDLAETYQISIIGERKFFPDDILVHTFQYYDPEHSIPLKGKSRIITMELQKAEYLINKPTREMDSSEMWSIFFKYLTNKSKREKINEILEREGEIAMAADTLIHISRDEIEQARLTTELKNILDYQSGMVSAKREGRAEGHKEGRLEEKLKIAQKMKSAGRSIVEIEEFTGLSSDVIQQIS